MRWPARLKPIVPSRCVYPSSMADMSILPIRNKMNAFGVVNYLELLTCQRSRDQIRRARFHSSLIDHKNQLAIMGKPSPKLQKVFRACKIFTTTVSGDPAWLQEHLAADGAPIVLAVDGSSILYQVLGRRRDLAHRSFMTDFSKTKDRERWCVDHRGSAWWRRRN